MAFTELGRTLAPPPEEKKEPAPRANQWDNRLRELPREWKLMLEDFGLTKSSASKYAEQAANGDEKSKAKLEPLKQFFFEMMGMTQHNRVVRHEDGKDALKPVMITVDGETRPKTEIRSVWGMREGYDLNVLQHAKKPKAAHHKNRVDRHFYSLVTLLEFLKKAVPLKIHGRAHPNPEGFKESHGFVTKGGTASAEAFADKKRLSDDIDKVIKATPDPARRDTLEMLKPFLIDGKKTTWDGLA